MYLAGVTAGLVSKTGKLGFVGAFQIPQLMRSINAFTLGAQSVNPNATTTVVWTGGWWEPQKEAEAVNAFADQGIDVVAEQVDSPITIAQTAEKRGIYMIGKDVDVHDRAPKAWLTGVSWNWGPMMEKTRRRDAAPASGSRPTCAATSRAAPWCSIRSVPRCRKTCASKVLAEKDEIVAGKKVVWTARSSRQDGKPAAAAGEKLSQPAVETMDYLVKGVIGSAK